MQNSMNTSNESVVANQSLSPFFSNSTWTTQKYGPDLYAASMTLSSVSSVEGTSNDDVLQGNGQKILGFNGQDQLSGGARNDFMSAGDGDDRLFGNSGKDWLLGGSGQDRLWGGLGGDYLDGGEGDDRLFGEDGRDWLLGGEGQDQLFGDAGNDILNGNQGDNTLTGGAGSDVFVIGRAGKSWITDFQVGSDLLALDGLTFDQIRIFSQNGETWITTRDNQPVAFLANVDASQLSSKDFADVSITQVLGNVESDWAKAFEDYTKNGGFGNGAFTVGQSGQVSIDYLFDGSAYEGKVAVFSLTGMEGVLQGDPDDFMKEVARRALSNSNLGHVVISDATEGARFSGDVGYEGNFNAGLYPGARAFSMAPGEKFGVMLVPNGSVEDVLARGLGLGGGSTPMFSIASLNLGRSNQFAQVVDAVADGNSFVFEDNWLWRGSDRDFNDVVFQVRGAIAKPISNKIIDPQQDWQNSNIGKTLVDYTKPYILPKASNLGEVISNEISDILTKAKESQISLNARYTINPSGFFGFDSNEWLKATNQSLNETLSQGSKILGTIQSQNNSGQNQARELINRLRTDLTSDINQVNSLLRESFYRAFTPTSESINLQLANTKEYLTSSVEEINILLKNFRAKYDEKLAQNSEALQGYNSLTNDAKDFFDHTISSYNSLAEEAFNVFDDFKTEYNSTEVKTVQDFSKIKDRYYVLVNKASQIINTSIASASALERSWDDWASDTEATLRLWQRLLASELPSTAQKTYTSSLPLIGIIDTGFSANNPDLDYSRIILGKDWVDKDANPLLKIGEGDDHGTQILNIIGATRGNSVGIDGINDRSPLWLGRAIGSNNWAQSLIEFVDEVKKNKYPNAIINLSFDLTETDMNGKIKIRSELTALERAALVYAQQNHILVVVAAGNDGKEMSALGQASVEFDNILTVGAANQGVSASNSNYGIGVDLVAEGNSETRSGTSIAAAKVTSAASLVWSANPQLNYKQVIDSLKKTATDLSIPNWDYKTGVGLLNISAAVNLARATAPKIYASRSSELLQSFMDELEIPADERPAIQELFYYFEMQTKLTATNWANPNGSIATERASDGNDVIVGAGTGAIIGGVVGGPIGSAIGGVAGGFIGFFSGLLGGGSDKAKLEAEKQFRETEAKAKNEIDGATVIFNQIKAESFEKLFDAQKKLEDAKINGASVERLTDLQISINKIQEQSNKEINQAQIELNSAIQMANDEVSKASDVLEYEKKIYEERQNVLSPWRRIADKGLAIVERGAGWVTQLPSRIIRIGEALTAPFYGDIWHEKFSLKNLGKFGLSLLGAAVDVLVVKPAEVLGAGEIYETVADLLKAGTRSLSEREKSVAKSVFGDSINLSLVRIDETGWSVPVTKAVTGAKSGRPFTTLHTINTWGPIDDQTLIHELTHVWQYENTGAVYMPNALSAQWFGDGYDYIKKEELSKLIKDQKIEDNSPMPSDDKIAEIKSKISAADFIKLKAGEVNRKATKKIDEFKAQRGVTQPLSGTEIDNIIINAFNDAFNEFNPEQQAHIIEDYYKYRENPSTNDDEYVANYAYFVRVVADKSKSIVDLGGIRQISLTNGNNGIDSNNNLIRWMRG